MIPALAKVLSFNSYLLLLACRQQMLLLLCKVGLQGLALSRDVSLWYCNKETRDFLCTISLQKQVVSKVWFLCCVTSYPYTSHINCMNAVLEIHAVGADN